MIDLIREALAVQEFLEAQDWSFCFIGGIALLRWGEPRVTRDIDATLFTGFGDEERFVRSLLARFEGRIPDAEAFALSRRVLLLRTPSGDGLDISLGGLPFERDLVDRSTKELFGDGYALRVCSADDLVVLKAFAARDQDWIDIRNIVRRQRTALDWLAIFDRLAPLVDLKEEPEILIRLRQIHHSP